MLPVSAPGVFFGPYVPVCDAPYASAPASAPYAGLALASNPQHLFRTDSSPLQIGTPSAVPLGVGGSNYCSSRTPCSHETDARASTVTRRKAKRASKYPSKSDTDAGNTHVGKTPCPFYLRTATCAYGAGCKFFHPPDLVPPPLNAAGLPVRQGEKNCPFYIKHGVCSFGHTCKFNHPILAKPLRRRSKPPPVVVPQMTQGPQSGGLWSSPVPTQGWYVPQLPTTTQHMLPTMYSPPYCCYENTPVVSGIHGSSGFTASPVVPYISMELADEYRNQANCSCEKCGHINGNTPFQEASTESFLNNEEPSTC